MTGDTRRDHWGRYLVLPPDGTKPAGYTRATTIAKVLDDGGGLIPWKATATIVGAVRRPGLLHRWQALIADTPDPWYATGASKKACKALVEECATAGGSSDRADIGTALHALTDLVDRGGRPLEVSATIAADLAAYRTTLDNAGVIIDDTLIERIVVLDRHRVAGTADRLAVTLPDGRHVVADLKTGADLTYSWQSIVVQLAIYANADNLYTQGDNPTGVDDVREPMPANLDRTTGLVIHLPAGTGTCTLYEIDLVAGWEAFELSLAAKAWRTRRNLATPHKIVGPVERVVVVPDLSDRATVVDDGSPTTVAPPPFETTTNKITDRADDGRITRSEKSTVAEGETSATVAPSAVDDWSAPVIPLQPASGLRDIQQARAVERSKLTHPSNTPPDEGATIDGTGPAAIKAHYEALPGDARQWISRLVTEAQRAGLSFHMTGMRTVRRFELLRGLIAVANADGPDDDVVRVLAVASLPAGTAPPPDNATTGATLGQLSATSAAIFANHCTTYAGETT